MDSPIVTFWHIHSGHFRVVSRSQRSSRTLVQKVVWAAFTCVNYSPTVWRQQCRAPPVGGLRCRLEWQGSEFNVAFCRGPLRCSYSRRTCNVYIGRPNRTTDIGLFQTNSHFRLSIPSDVLVICSLIMHANSCAQLLWTF